MKCKYHIRNFFLLMATVIGCGWLVSCSEDIDMGNRYTFTDETVLSFLEKNLNLNENRTVPYERQFTEYITLLNQVPISDMSSSTVAQLLSARGNFTVFAPNNQAISNYLQELKEKGVITEASWSGFKDEASLDSIRKVIVYNSIIDCDEEPAYETGSFPANEKDPFPRSNLNDRKLYWTYNHREEVDEKGKKVDVYDPDSIFINGKALVDLSNRDLEAINGRIHEIFDVIAPSNETMTDIFKQWIAENSGQYVVFAKLLLACGFSDTLSKTRDEAWEKVWKTNAVTDLGEHPSYHQYGHVPEHRKYGFTIFAETDDLWEDKLQKTKDQITVEDVKTWLVGTSLFTGVSTGTDYDNEDNILNRFVSYHMLPVALSRDKLVIHYNEKGHLYTSKTKTIPVYDYYTTMGKRRLMKIYEPDGSDNSIYLNRFPVLQNGRGRFSEENENLNDYHESGEFKEVLGSAMYPDAGEAGENRGVKILLDQAVDSENDPLNGYIYPIDRFLMYTENIERRLHGERIRIDCATIFPEMINNDYRRPMSTYAKPARCTHSSVCDKCVGFPANPQYPYFADVDIEKNTSFYYLSGYSHGWSNYQMDEFNIIGNYEFTMKLPPVPTKDIYELRFGVSSGSNNRSMCQVYWGENPAYLPAAGIPMDLRIGFVSTRFYGSGNQISTFGYTTTDEYKADSKLTQEEQDEIDKRLRSRDFMKGPEYFYYGTSASNDDVGRNHEHVTRRIMVRKEMDPDKTYYIRFKNVLDNANLEFFMDYLEFVSKDVYDNPEEPEDIW